MQRGGGRRDGEKERERRGNKDITSSLAIPDINPNDFAKENGK